MLNLLTEKFIAKNELNNQNLYIKNLKNSSYVKKYFEDIYKNWIEYLENPLEIDIVRLLFENDLNHFNENLEKCEKELGEENLKKIFCELKKEKGEAQGIMRKFESLICEIQTGIELKKRNFKKLKKIHKDGDWESEDKIISVKSILDLDFNFQIIENILTGLFYIKENEILRKFNKVFVSKYKNLNNTFLNYVFEFFRKELNNIIEEIDKKLKENISYSKKNNKDNISVNFCAESLKKSIFISIQNENDSFLEMSFEHDSNNNSLSFQTIENIFPLYEEINFNYFKKSIKEKIEKLNNKDKKDNFIIWINISIHPRHENYLRNNIMEVKKFFSENFKEINLKINYCFKPQIGFDFKEPIVFEI